MKIKKIIPSLLAMAVLVTSILPVSAAESDITTTTGQMEIPVTIKSVSTYEIAIPKKITLIKGTADSFPINVKGDLAVDEKLVITTSPTMTMEQNSGTKGSVDVTSAIEKKFYSWSEITGDGCASKVNVDTTNLSAGKWSGACAVNVVISTLPEEYTLVKSLKADGNQCIDTEYILNKTYDSEDDFTLNCDFEVNDFSFETYPAVYGCSDDNYYNKIKTGVHMWEGTMYLDISVGNHTGNKSYSSNVPLTLSTSMNDSGCYVDGELAYTPHNKMINTVKSIYLFNLNGTDNDLTKGFIGNIKGFSIIKNGETVVNMVPCIENSTGKAGMYDTVRKQFYRNIGTGEFGYDSY